MKFNFKILIATIVLVNVCCISSNLIYYKDSSYFDKPNKMNKLYLFPITSVKFDRASRDFTEYHLLRDPLSIEETFLDHFNSEYMRMAKNNLNKNKITLIDSTFDVKYSADDTNQCESKKIYNKGKDNLFRVKIPKKKIIDSIGISCNYGLFITDVKLLQTSYYVPFVVPFPGVL